MHIIFIFIATAMYQCPSAAEVAECEDCEVVSLPQGCPSPYDGLLVTPGAFQRATAELSGLEFLVLSCRRSLESARGELGGALDANATMASRFSTDTQAFADRVDALSSPPSRAVWASLGAAAGAIVAAVVLGVL